MGLLLASIDAPTATVLVAIVGAFVTFAAKAIPKTKSESAVDMAKVRLDDATAWQTLVKSLEGRITSLQADLDAERGRTARLELRVAELEHGTA